MRNLALAILLGAAALTPDRAVAQPDHAKTLERAITEHAVPAYRHLAAATADLAETLAGTCGKPDGAAAQHAAFNKAIDAWEAAQHLRSGPVARQDRHARMEFWPDDRGTGGRHLSRLIATGSAKDLDDIAGASVAVQGFPALERLLYGKTPLSTTPEDGTTLSGCAVADAIAGNMAAIAKELVDGVAAKDAFGTDPKEAVRGLFGDLITSLQVVYQLKLRAPAAEEGKSKPRLAENWRSARALKNVRLNAAAMKALYAALYGPNDGDPEHELILGQFDVAEKEAARLGDSLTEVLAAKDGWIQVRALASTLDDLKNLIAMKLTEHLDVSLGFNSLDGD